MKQKPSTVLKYALPAVALLVLHCCAVAAATSEANVITVYCSRERGAVNRLVLGTNFIAYDPSTYENWGADFRGYKDFGAGIWDPALQRSVPAVVSLARDAGVSTIRFPGGAGTHQYNWKKAIGPQRQEYQYGIDEFLQTCREVDAEPVFTMSYFTGTEVDAADFIAYLNSPYQETEASGRENWANKRAANGHPAPYNVKYFEIGNEVWAGDHRAIKSVAPEAYAQRYLKFYRAMKAVDPTVQIGVVLYDMGWNRRVLEIVQKNVDFAVLHIYPTPEVGMDTISNMAPNKIFQITFSVMSDFYEPYLKDVGIFLKEKAGKKVPLMISEFNAGFTQDTPVPYRHALGAALVNAELINIFMKPEHNVLMAHYWQFSNSYWGMVYTDGDYTIATPDAPPSYYKRPNYYPFELYNRHFGDVLLETHVAAEEMPKIKEDFFRNALMKIKEFLYACPAGSLPPPRNMSSPYLSVNASKSRDGNTVYLVVINKNMDRKIDAQVILNDFDAQTNARAWILAGPGVDTTNENMQERVSVREQELSLGEGPIKVTFEPHAMTVIELKRR